MKISDGNCNDGAPHRKRSREGVKNQSFEIDTLEAMGINAPASVMECSGAPARFIRSTLS
jgi:hypothetical protein